MNSAHLRQLLAIATCKKVNEVTCMCHTVHTVVLCKRGKVLATDISRDYSKLDLLPLFGVVKIFLELEIKITGLGNSNFIETKSQM